MAHGGIGGHFEPAIVVRHALEVILVGDRLAGRVKPVGGKATRSDEHRHQGRSQAVRSKAARNLARRDFEKAPLGPGSGEKTPPKFAAHESFASLSPDQPSSVCALALPGRAFLRPVGAR